jgi:hypothetical protein
MPSESSNLVNNYKIKSNWQVHAENLKARYSDLTTEDLFSAPNEEEILILKIAKRLNKSQVEVIKLLESTAPRTL